MKTPVLASNVTPLLKQLYGAEITRQIEPRLRKLLAAAPIAPRNFEATEADAILIAFPDKIQKPGQAPLHTLGQFSKRHFDGAITGIHILPFYPWTSDRGFGVSDYTRVKAEYGDWGDVHDLGRHFRLAFDFVLNHVSASHPWFTKFLAGDTKYQNFFIALSPETDTSRVTRPRTSPLLTPFECTGCTKYVWTTFGPDQVDLNYANPEVLLEMVSVLLDYIRQGADIIRLDSANYIWKDLSTNCNGLPQTHAFIQLLRAVTDEAAPWVRLLSETNVTHPDNLSYFGNGHNEAHMVYNFALPALTIDALLTGNAETISRWATGLRLPSDKTSFFNFLACHDGIMVNAARDLIPEDRLNSMFRFAQQRGGALSYKSTPSGEIVYEMNTTYYSLLTDPAEPLAQAVDRFTCSQSIMLTLAGIPGIYLNSLIGSVNYTEGIQQYNRLVNEEQFNFDTLERELSTPGSPRRLILDRYTNLLKLRAAHPAFHPQAAQRILNLGPSIFAVERTARDGSSKILALHNVTSRPVEIQLENPTTDVIAGQTFAPDFTLAPYQVAWLEGYK